MNQLTEIEKAYIAGFFDGEGCISIGKTQGQNNRSPTYHLQVILTQASPDPIVDLFNIVGIGSLHKKKSKKSEHIVDWRMGGAGAVLFLQSIMPYLRNKKAEALIAIDFVEKCGGRDHLHGKGKGRGYTVPPEITAIKESYYLQLQAIKGESGRRGRGRPKRL